jgi:hypothetical protein
MWCQYHTLRQDCYELLTWEYRGTKRSLSALKDTVPTCARKELSKATKTDQSSHFPARDSKPGPTECDVEMLTITPLHCGQLLVNHQGFEFRRDTSLPKNLNRI